jgi:hypothetical protein
VVCSRKKLKENFCMGRVFYKRRLQEAAITKSFNRAIQSLDQSYCLARLICWLCSSYGIGITPLKFLLFLTRWQFGCSCYLPDCYTKILRDVVICYEILVSHVLHQDKNKKFEEIEIRINNDFRHCACINTGHDSVRPSYSYHHFAISRKNGI